MSDPITRIAEALERIAVAMEQQALPQPEEQLTTMWNNKRHQQLAAELTAFLEKELAGSGLSIDVAIQHADFVWVQIESEEQETFIDIRLHFKNAAGTLLKLIREEHSKGPKP